MSIKNLIAPVIEIWTKPVLTTSGSWLLTGQMYRKDSRYRERIEATINDRRCFPPEIFDTRTIHQTWEDYLGGNTGLHYEIDTLISFGSLSRLIPFEGLDF